MDRPGNETLAPGGRGDNEQQAGREILLEAWIETRRETDRTLITLASGGIAVLVTLQTTLGVHSLLELRLYGAAFVAFLLAVLTGLWILRRDATLLAALIRGDRRSTDPMLKWLDRALLLSFVLGVLISGYLGIAAGAASLTHKSPSMNRTECGSAEIKPDIEKKSMDGLQDLISSRPPKESEPVVVPTKPAAAPASKPAAAPTSKPAVAPASKPPKKN